MNYPIVLTGDSRSIYACEWDCEIYEIHTLESLQKEYGETNLFDLEPSWYSFSKRENLTFLEVLEDLEQGEYKTITNDNMTITILKRGNL